MNTEQRNRLLQELFEHATESIIVIDQSGSIQLVNPSTERFFGYTRDEFYGKKVEFLIPERFGKRHVKHRSDYNKNPHSRAMGMGMDLFAKRKDGSEFPVEISLSPFESEGNRFIIAFIIDITRRKRAEAEIVRKQAELEAANEKLEMKVQDRTKVLQEALTEIEKSREELAEALEKEKYLNELKSRFLSMASHEFRTPLTTILSSAVLIPEYTLPEQQIRRVKHVERIKSAVNNLNDILTDFLSLSTIEEGRLSANLKKFNLKNSISELCGEMKVSVKNGQQIIYEHTGEEEARLDEKLVRNIVINLLSNASKFSEEHKKILLKTFIDKNKTEITVKDEGMGISKEDQEHLFERFFRGQNAGNIQGTGLGLNIVTKYVELMYGKIDMESELEKGTVFTVTFPNTGNED